VKPLQRGIEGMSRLRVLRKRSKTSPCCESGSWAALQFSRWRKILNVSQRIHLRFFPIVKIEHQPNLHFLATGRFCLASLGVAVVLCGILGCAPTPPPEPKRIDEIRPVPPAHRVTTYSLQRRDLQALFSKGTDNTIRLVPIYESSASRASHEYRLFDTRPGSVYALLGLENSDVLVAADGYLIKKPEQFVVYVQLLTKQNEATIEIRRGGEPRLFKYVLLPALPVGR
jgi:hypothetical protein